MCSIDTIVKTVFPAHSTEKKNAEDIFFKRKRRRADFQNVALCLVERRKREAI